MLSENKGAFLSLVRLGIGTGTISGCKLQVPIDWNALEDLAARQGLSAVVVDGVGKLPEDKRPPKPVLLQWIGETLHGYEYRYEQYRKAIAGLASFYNKHGYRMMVLKGYACSLDWPRPEHRPCGDIDIWLFGRQAAADAALSSKFKVQSLKFKVQSSKFKIDRSHHHHTVFDWDGFTVENHYDFVNVHAHRSSAELEKVFKELGTFKVESGEFRVEGQLNGCSVEGCKIPCVDVYGEKIYLPSANLHALFLIKHMVSHFAAAEISLRQVLDWAFFVEKHGKDVEWDWLEGLLEKFGMWEFYCIINAICVEDLGFDAVLFRSAPFNSQLKDRVLNDILFPAYGTMEPKSMLAKWAYRYRRWQGNAWKHSLCYSEGRWESLWPLLMSHMMKPEVE